MQERSQFCDKCFRCFRLPLLQRYTRLADSQSIRAGMRLVFSRLFEYTACERRRVGRSIPIPRDVAVELLRCGYGGLCMRIDNAFKTALLIGIGAGIGIGFLAFDSGVRAQINKTVRKSMKMARRQTADIRDTAANLIERGEKELRFVANKGRRIYREVAS